MDLKKLANMLKPRGETVVADKVAVQIKHPVTGLPLFNDETGQPVVAIIHTRTSAKYRSVLAVIRCRHSWGKKSQDALVEDARYMLVELTDAIYNVKLYGDDITTKPILSELYADARFRWLYDQIDDAIGST